MKFLCIPCDEAMKLQQTRGPDQGSLTVIFGCPKCFNQIALLTNPIETQLVKALDVKIGKGPARQGPLELVRSSLQDKRQSIPPTAPSSGCPFSAMIPAGSQEPAGEPLPWSVEAERRLERVPEFVRPWARKSIERFARARGYREITEDVMDEARKEIGP